MEELQNAFVFKGSIKNTFMDFPFVWDELNILVTYGSDVEVAKKIVLDIVSELLSECTENSLAKWKEMVKLLWHLLRCNCLKYQN